MNFFDIKPEALPRDAQYYFNILVIVMSVNQETWNLLTGDMEVQVEDIWYIDRITDPEPTIYCIYQEDDMDEDTDLEIGMFPHKVVEVSSRGITWYDMIDFDTDDPWNLGGAWEEG